MKITETRRAGFDTFVLSPFPKERFDIIHRVKSVFLSAKGKELLIEFPPFRQDLSEPLNHCLPDCSDFSYKRCILYLNVGYGLGILFYVCYVSNYCDVN